MSGRLVLVRHGQSLRQRRTTARHPAAGCRAHRSRPRAGAQRSPASGRTTSAMVAHSVALRAVADGRRDRRRARTAAPRVRRHSRGAGRRAGGPQRRRRHRGVQRHLPPVASGRPRRAAARRRERPQVLDRYVPVLTQLRMRYLDDDAWHGDIVVVSHGAAIRLAAAALAGVDGELRPRPSPGQRRIGCAGADHRRPVELSAVGRADAAVLSRARGSPGRGRPAVGRPDGLSAARRPDRTRSRSRRSRGAACTTRA